MEKDQANSLIADARELGVNLNQAVLELQEALAYSTDRLDLLSTHNTPLATERDLALNSLKETNASYQHLKTDLDALLKRNAESENEVTSLRKQVIDLQSEIEPLSDANKQLTTERNLALNSLNETNGIYQKLRRDFEALEKRNAASTADLQWFSVLPSNVLGFRAL